MAEENGAAEPSEVERIKAESRGLYGTLAAELANDATHLTDDAKQLLKFHGSYEQEDRDLRRERKKAGLEPAWQFMIRSKIPGGFLTAEQYLAHDDLAGRFANQTLRVTTRQDFQLHGVVKRDLRRTIGALNEALITTLGACGDVVRNVLSCPAPLAGGLRNEVLEVTRRVSQHLLPTTRAYHEIWLNGELVAGGEPEPDPIYGTNYLPRKFKTAIAFPEDNCTDVFSNDLGLVVIQSGEHLAGFNVLVGGGLGRTHGKDDTFPRLASPLAFVTPEQVVEIATAVVVVQRDHGNRSERRRARLKYLLEERGVDWFREQVERVLGRRLEPPRAVEVTGIHNHLGWHRQSDGQWFLGVFIENGRIRDTDERRMRAALRRVLETIRPGVRLTPQQNILLTDVPAKRRREIDHILADHGVPAASDIPIVRSWSMACPALPTCPLALAESERALPGVLDELHVELQRLGLLEEEFTVRMTGCPNGCARPYTADIAFVGRSLDKYVIYVGGNLEGTRLASPYADLVPRQRLVSALVPLLEHFREVRLPGERFGDFWHRSGPTALHTLREAAGERVPTEV
jgi:sulfite reductase (ferredoxin)